MSFGNVPQRINFDQNEIVLVLGENYDSQKTHSGILRNGAGKTSIINGLCYALFGQPLLNIKRDNLINNINQKNMEVKVVFSKNDSIYEIHRGRKPNFLIYRVNNKDVVNVNQKDQKTIGEDETESTQENTQKQIEKVLGFDIFLFRHIFAMNTYTEPFLSMRLQDQRVFIETLFKINELSEKGDRLKEKIKETREEFLRESAAIEAHIKNNENIKRIIEDNLKKSRVWQQNKEKKLEEINKKIKSISSINVIEQEKLLENYEKLKRKIEDLVFEDKQTISTIDHLKKEIKLLENSLSFILQKDEAEEKFQSNREKLKDDTQKYILLIDEDLFQKEKDLKELLEKKDYLQQKIENPDLPLCTYCGQKIDDKKKLEEYRNELMNEKKEISLRINRLQQNIEQILNKKIEQQKILEECENEKDKMDDNKEEIEYKKKDLYQKIEEKKKIFSQILETRDLLEDEILQLTEQEKNLKKSLLFSTRDEYIMFIKDVESLIEERDRIQKEEDPYLKHVKELEEKGLKEIKYDKYNQLNNILRHQEFLHKMLTSKDSFIRKKVMEQNILFLNARLSAYVEELGLPHKIVLQNDLSVDISYFGRSMDFDNLSRGERTRLVLGLGWAFRDVFESLNYSVNMVFIDELLDHGLDQGGIESSIYILKKMARDRGKSVFLISHRDELVPRTDKTIFVRKEDGFSSIIDIN